MPEMKDFPKCFFLQACRGKGKTMPASAPAPSNNPAIQVPQFYSPHLDNTPLLANGRDILICYPTQYGMFSFCDENWGSWFVQEIVSALNKYYKTEHLLDILVEAIRINSEKMKPFQKEIACQVR